MSSAACHTAKEIANRVFGNNVTFQLCLIQKCSISDGSRFIDCIITDSILGDNCIFDNCWFDKTDTGVDCEFINCKAINNKQLIIINLNNLQDTTKEYSRHRSSTF